MVDKPISAPRKLDKVANFLMHYGDFHAFWTTFHVMIEILIMRELRTSREKASIVCAGLGFGAKANIACSLLNSRPSGETARTVALIKQAQQIAERNSFSHGFFLVNRETEKVELIRREVKDTYVARLKEFDFATMANHTKAFIAKVEELRVYAAISESDFLDYVKDIEVHALDLASRGKPLPAPPTNSGKAKPKLRR